LKFARICAFSNFRIVWCFDSTSEVLARVLLEVDFSMFVWGPGTVFYALATIMGQREEEAWKVAKTVNIVIPWLRNWGWKKARRRRRMGNRGWNWGFTLGYLVVRGVLQVEGWWDDNWRF